MKNSHQVYLTDVLLHEHKDEEIHCIIYNGPRLEPTLISTNVRLINYGLYGIPHGQKEIEVYVLTRSPLRAIVSVRGMLPFVCVQGCMHMRVTISGRRHRNPTRVVTSVERNRETEGWEMRENDPTFHV